MDCHAVRLNAHALHFFISLLVTDSGEQFLFSVSVEKCMKVFPSNFDE